MRGMLANLVTGCRIVLSLIILQVSIYSPWFYVCYLLAGLTDMIDGTIAHKLGTDSEFGEKFDTVADIVFVVAASYKLLPELEIDMAIWVWIGAIALIKVINIISGLVIHKKIAAVHSRANRITGLVLFILPFTLFVIDINYSAIAVCILATFAAIQEGHLIRSKVLE